MTDQAQTGDTRSNEGAHLDPVLVIGATGRIGRQVVAQLLDAGVPVRALTRRPEAAGRGHWTARRNKQLTPPRET